MVERSETIQIRLACFLKSGLSRMLNVESPNDILSRRIHDDQIAGGHRHHRVSRFRNIARSPAGTGIRAGNTVQEQSVTNRHSHAQLCFGVWSTAGEYGHCADTDNE